MLNKSENESKINIIINDSGKYWKYLKNGLLCLIMFFPVIEKVHKIAFASLYGNV